MTADPEHPNGCICVKGVAAPEIVSSPDRLHYPIRRTRPKGEADPGWVRISWDEALELTARRLLDIRARYGPEAVVFSRATPAGSATHDFADWLERLANAFGSPNIMTTTHICTWNRMWGAKYTYGVPMPGGVTPSPDEEHTRCMLFWGVNPQSTAPTTALRISRAKARGAKLIVIDPRQHKLAAKADCWLRVRPGSDGALALSMIHVLLEEELYDAPFVRTWTNGPFLIREDTQQLLMSQDLSPSGTPGTFTVWDCRSGAPVGYHPDTGYAQDGVEPALLGTFAITLADGKAIACRPALELLRALAAQHSPERSEAITWVPADSVRSAVRLFATEKPSFYSTWVGLEQHTNAMQTNRAVCCFYALTGQFDSRGSNVLFASTCWEGEALRPSFDGSADVATWVQLRQAVVAPVAESRPDLEILFDLAQRLGLGAHFCHGDIEAAFNEQLAPSGLTVQQLRAHTLGMRVEIPTRYQKYAEIEAQTGQPRGFPTPTRKIEIYATRFASVGYAPLPVYHDPLEGPVSRPEGAQEYPLVLTFFRLGQFCDEQHRHIPRLRRQVPEPLLEIHSHTATAAGIADGDWVVLETAIGRVRLKAKCNDALHPRVVATQYGWWQGCPELGLRGYDPFGPDGANVNLLIPNAAIDPISASVQHRSQMCRIRKEG